MKRDELWSKIEMEMRGGSEDRSGGKERKKNACKT